MSPMWGNLQYESNATFTLVFLLSLIITPFPGHEKFGSPFPQFINLFAQS